MRGAVTAGAAAGLALAVLVAVTGVGGGRDPLPGFGRVGFRVEPAGVAGRVAVADDAAERARGLMRVDDLGGLDGMLFAFPRDTTAPFWMKDTRLPLSVAFFDASGRFVSSADMTPCDAGADCPLYAPAAPYRWALEVRQGRLRELGVGPGARLVLDR